VEDFKNITQSLAVLYRKWYIEKKKDLNKPYDKEQIDDLFDLVRYKLKNIIDHLTKNKITPSIIEIPFFFINRNKYHDFIVEIFPIENTIECINIPGCMAEGSNFQIAFDNLIRAIIQCADARSRNGLWYLNRVYPMKLYYPNMEEICSDDLIQNLIDTGWNIHYKGPYHTVLLREGSKITYTIQNNSRISKTMHFAYIHLQFLITRQQQRNMY
jgi:hypothetical protein